MKRQPQYALNKNKYLMPPEVYHLEQTLSGFEERDLRNALMLQLALKTGARAQELLNITRGDLNPHERSVLIKGIKGSNDREIPIPRPLFEKLIKLVELDTDRIFPITYDRLYQIWLMYRPVKKKFHALRHTFAIQLYQKTKNIQLVQTALGHRSITNTMIYANYAYTQAELRKLIL